MDILRRYRQQINASHGKRKVRMVPLEGDSVITHLVMKISGGMIKDTRTANYVMLLIAGISIIIAIFIVYSTVRGPSVDSGGQNPTRQGLPTSPF